jgi:hypothetical protein
LFHCPQVPGFDGPAEVRCQRTVKVIQDLVPLVRQIDGRVRGRRQKTFLLKQEK